MTQKEYKKVMNDENPSYFKHSNNPVESVSWDNAVKFCERITDCERKKNRLPPGYVYRLPTEAEWEYSCRTNTLDNYSFGKSERSLHKFANYCDLDCKKNWKNKEYRDKFAEIAPVGSFLPNNWGLHDMHGNVWEWCLDWKGDYGRDTQTDPWGPKSGEHRVKRGGSWYNGARFCRSNHRAAGLPEKTRFNIGFRVVLAPVLPQ